jgi:hypothetical protein
LAKECFRLQLEPLFHYDIIGMNAAICVMNVSHLNLDAELQCADADFEDIDLSFHDLLKVP